MRRKSKPGKTPKFIINNKMKPFGRMDTKTNIVEVNKKKHKGDKRELADTIQHELLHVKHPNMKEKSVYKKTSPELSQKEQNALVAKLRSKKINYKLGAAKRRFKIDRKQKTEPGAFISKLNSLKSERKAAIPKSPAPRTAIMGLI